MYAIAFDLGTTTLAASLFERTTGRRLAMVGSLNPQREYGADVVSRLDAAVHDPSAAAAMTTLICNELARLGQAVLQQSGVGMQTVRLAALAGNPAMQHLLLGWPVESLARPPFRPRQTAGLTIAAAELDWTFCEQVYLFPQPGGFVGGDTVAFLFGCAAAQPVAPALYLDMGTNGEMVLDDGVTLWATSAAAGPAFEGGNLACGMAALSGAICGVTLDGDRLRIETIGNSRPRGVCGSAVIQLVAALRRDGIIDRSGRLLAAAEVESNLATRIVDQGEGLAFVLYRDAQGQVFVSQNDIRQLQLAKGAVRAGLEVLLERARIRCDALQDLILTGSFGAVLEPEALKTVGIFSEEMVEKCRFVREGALAGVEQLLSQVNGIPSVEQLAARFRVIPLSGTPLFEQKFLEQIDFPA
ncbi:MAG: ASKHA domain-containing protein [Trichlorobacter sp.]